jgi:hypothetical protein
VKSRSRRGTSTLSCCAMVTTPTSTRSSRERRAKEGRQ